MGFAAIFRLTGVLPALRCRAGLLLVAVLMPAMLVAALGLHQAARGSFAMDMGMSRDIDDATPAVTRYPDIHDRLSFVESGFQLASKDQPGSSSSSSSTSSTSSSSSSSSTVAVAVSSARRALAALQADEEGTAAPAVSSEAVASSHTAPLSAPSSSHPLPVTAGQLPDVAAAGALLAVELNSASLPQLHAAEMAGGHGGEQAGVQAEAGTTSGVTAGTVKADGAVGGSASVG